MKEKRMRELMRSADDSQLRYIAGCKASEDAEKERIFRRVRNAQRITKAPPITESAPIPMEKHTGHFEWLHGAGSVIAACLVVVVTVGMIVAVKQAKPPISPGTPVTEQAACKVPVYTPFGNILDAELLFRYPTETTRNAQQQMRENGNPDAVLMEERTLTKEQQQALAEVFRVYGWREQANNSAPESTVTDDCIEMHLYRTPERNSDDVTAYFQFDGEGQHLVRVDENGETKWYDLDKDIIRCLRSIIMNQQPTEYQPPERRFADVMSRITYVSDDTGERLLGSMTPGQGAAISTLLNNATLYEWNTLRDPNPMHGRYIRMELMEPLKPDETPAQQTYGRMTFWLDTGCLTYEITDTFHGSEEDVIVSGSDHRYQYYWVDESAFMEKAEKLFRESVYPGCPVGDLMEVELSADPEPKGVNATTWKGQLSAYLNTLEWKEIICPVDEEIKYNYKQLELVYVRDDKKYSLTFYPEQNFMEWTEEHEKYTLVDTDDTQIHVVSHYFSMPEEVWMNIAYIQEGGTPDALKGMKYGAPFGEISEGKIYFMTEDSAPQYFSVSKIGGPQNLPVCLNHLQYEEADFTEGMMAGGKCLNMFINDADTGRSRMLEVWSSGDIIAYSYDADGTEHKQWVKTSEDVYERIMQELNEPDQRFDLPYKTRAAIKQHLPEVLAQMFPVIPKSTLPFMETLENNVLYNKTDPLTEQQKTKLLQILIQIDFAEQREADSDAIPDDHVIVIGIGAPAGVEGSENAKGFLYLCKESHMLRWNPAPLGTQRNLEYPLSEEQYKQAESLLSNSQQPFMNLLLSSYLITFKNYDNVSISEHFSVPLHEENVRYTADLFQVQELFDELSWQEITPVEFHDHIVGYIEVDLGNGLLLIGTELNEDGNCLINYQNQSEVLYYYAAKEQIQRLLEILSKGNTISSGDDAAKESEQIVQNAKAFLQNNCADILDTINWSLTDSGKTVKLPDSYQEVTQLEWKPGSERIGSFWQVTFHTSQDGLLGPVIVYLTDDGTVIGLGERE